MFGTESMTLGLKAILELKRFECLGNLVLWLFRGISAPGILTPAQLCGIRRKQSMD